MQKIEENIERDKRAVNDLLEIGFLVRRFCARQPPSSIVEEVTDLLAGLERRRSATLK